MLAIIRIIKATIFVQIALILSYRTISTSGIVFEEQSTKFKPRNSVWTKTSDKTQT